MNGRNAIATLPVKTNTKIAKASSTRKRFQSLRTALAQLIALCASNKKTICANNNANTDSNTSYNVKEDDDNKRIQSRKQRRNAKQHNTTDKDVNNDTSVQCVARCVDAEKQAQLQ